MPKPSHSFALGPSIVMNFLQSEPSKWQDFCLIFIWQNFLNLLNFFSYDCGSDYEIIAVPPTDVKFESLANDVAGASDNLLYSLVVTIEMSRNDNELGPQQPSDIVRQ